MQRNEIECSVYRILLPYAIDNNHSWQGEYKTDGREIKALFGWQQRSVNGLSHSISTWKVLKDGTSGITQNRPMIIT
jgi:hypothetical protein